MENIYRFIQPFKKYLIEACLILSAVVVVIISAAIYISARQTNSSHVVPKIQTKEVVNKSDSDEIIIVDVTGAVMKPDSYTLPSSARLKDALEKAGGLSELADKDFFYRNFNLAQNLADQQKIYVPSVIETASGIFKENYRLVEVAQASTVQAVQESDDSGSKVHINSSSSEELDSLPGIGAATAQKIIDNRPYSQLDTLLSKKIVGSATFDKIKNLIDL